MPKTPREQFMSAKMEEIKKKGIRRNTHAPVSKNNPRRKVSQKQAVAIAMDMARRKGMTK
jgi:hypothetical protein